MPFGLPKPSNFNRFYPKSSTWEFLERQSAPKCPKCTLALSDPSDRLKTSYTYEKMQKSIFVKFLISKIHRIIKNRFENRKVLSPENLTVGPVKTLQVAPKSLWSTLALPNDPSAFRSTFSQVKMKIHRSQSALGRPKCTLEHFGHFGTSKK